MTFQTMCSLRIYLRRGDNATEKGFWKRMFKRPLSHVLLQDALRAGITHASVSLGHMGFAKGATGVSMDISEVPVTTLPVCLELVAAKPLLEQFVRDHAGRLKDATLVMLEGVHVRPQIEETAADEGPHHVEYVRVGDVTVPVDHVAVGASAR